MKHAVGVGAVGYQVEQDYHLQPGQRTPRPGGLLRGARQHPALREKSGCRGSCLTRTRSRRSKR